MRIPTSAIKIKIRSGICTRCGWPYKKVSMSFSDLPEVGWPVCSECEEDLPEPDYIELTPLSGGTIS